LDGASIFINPCPAPCSVHQGLDAPGVVIYQPGQTDVHETMADVSNCVTFRNPTTNRCPGATPTEKSTWGSIKALYR